MPPLNEAQRREVVRNLMLARFCFICYGPQLAGDVLCRECRNAVATYRDNT
jgi:hypothetical protein